MEYIQYGEQEINYLTKRPKAWSDYRSIWIDQKSC